MMASAQPICDNILKEALEIAYVPGPKCRSSRVKRALFTNSSTFSNDKPLDNITASVGLSGERTHQAED
ncbi:hypothetical protein HZ326_30375 [Fusarium oxysporum f. sp. albedinis]|nr:hypothetical protein HZ326_30375 [Fusarium oxysporum f. sp. albedinis]